MHTLATSKLFFAGFLMFSAALAHAIPCAPPTVILVSIDGLGAHLLNLARMPELKKLIEQGAMAREAHTTDLMKTLPGHASMLSGLTPKRHGITFNDTDKDTKPIAVPTVFDLAKDHQLESSAVVGKRKLKFIFSSTGVTHLLQPEAFPLGELYGRLPSVVTSVAVKEMPRSKFLFVHYALGDTFGHWFRWERFPQLWALGRIDTAIGELKRAADEKIGVGKYAMIVTSDHGGHEGSHGQRNAKGEIEDAERDLKIPFIVYGATLKSPTELVNIIDTAPSIAELLQLSVPADWNWQGQSRVTASCPKL